MALRLILAGLIAAAAFAPPALARSAPIDQRVTLLEDEAAIRQVLIEYGAFLDGRDYAAYAALFAPDGVWTGGFGSFTGPAAIQQMLETNLGKAEPGYVNKSSFHMLTNPVIIIQGNRAQVTSKYMFWTRSPDNRPVPAMAGRYVDDMVKLGGQWKIARRTTWGEIPFRDPAAPAASAPPSPALSLETRLQRVEDQLAIQRIITDYAARIDAHDFDGYAALFAREGVWQNGKTVRKGAEEIKAMLVGLFGTPPPGYINAESYHLVSNIEVNVDGDMATARSRHLLMMRDDQGHPRPALAGWYADVFIREDGQWKILHRVDNPLMPTAEEWRKEMAARQPKP